MLTDGGQHWEPAFCYSEADAIGNKTDWHPNKRCPGYLNRRFDMRRALAVLSVVAAMVFAGTVLTGCSGDDAGGDDAADADAASTDGE